MLGLRISQILVILQRLSCGPNPWYLYLVCVILVILQSYRTIPLVQYVFNYFCLLPLLFACRPRKCEKDCLNDIPIKFSTSRLRDTRLPVILPFSGVLFEYHTFHLFLYPSAQKAILAGIWISSTV